MALKISSFSKLPTESVVEFGKNISLEFRSNSAPVGLPASGVMRRTQSGNSPTGPVYALASPIIVMLAIISMTEGPNFLSPT